MSFDAEKIVARVRAGFEAGGTKSQEARERHLNDLIRLVTENEKDLIKAVHNDFRKISMEFVLYEIEMVKNEAVQNIHDLKENMKLENRNPGSLATIGKQLQVQKQPFGVVLIIGAWNFPLQLLLVPLVGAIAAGNAAVIKPSELTPEFAQLLEKLLPRYLDNECFQLINGDAVITTQVLKQRFDHIFYTGSSAVGKIIMKAAAEHLTPVTLELGGKSPTYVDEDCDLTVAAKRIVWGKYTNAGQTCVAPDYIMCELKTRDKLIQEIEAQVKKMFGEDAQKSPDYCRIVNDRHFKRVARLLENLGNGKIAFGGKTDEKDRYIAPTVVKDVEADDTLMQEEIFGPVLPIMTVNGVNEAIRVIRSREKPLALYVFTNNKVISDRFLDETSSGGIAINDTVIHVGLDALPFGGVGNSGMGCYHGKYSAETFSHKRAYYRDTYYSYTDFTMSPRYPPYSEANQNRLRSVLRKKTKNEKMVYTFIKYAFVLAILAWVFKFLELDQIFTSVIEKKMN